jgi:acetolactate synthase-1/3 small subunit
MKAEHMTSRHIISILVENQFGVLARVSGLFSARGYNIDSLCVGETDDPTVSRMTVVVRGDGGVLGQIIKQLNKLIGTIEVQDVTSRDHVERELVLVRVAGKGRQRSEIMEITDIFRAKIVDLSAEGIIAEITGSGDKIAAFIDMMRPFGIKEVVRTGKVAIVRSPKNNSEG